MNYGVLFTKIKITDNVIVYIWDTSSEESTTEQFVQNDVKSFTHTRTHTHTYIYIYIYICLCVCIVKKYDRKKLKTKLLKIIYEIFFLE